LPSHFPMPSVTVLLVFADRRSSRLFPVAKWVHKVRMVRVDVFFQIVVHKKPFESIIAQASRCKRRHLKRLSDARVTASFKQAAKLIKFRILETFQMCSIRTFDGIWKHSARAHESTVQIVGGWPYLKSFENIEAPSFRKNSQTICGYLEKFCSLLENCCMHM
jgi:hypothetical protein